MTDKIVSRQIPIRSEDEFLQDQDQLMRAGVYEILANLLAREPASSLLAALAGLDEVETSDGQMAMAWEMLRQGSAKTSVGEVKDEYFNLFLGVGRGELVPFGSWYMTGFLMEKPVAVLRGELATLGIERQEGIVESEDHIAALCESMAIIIRSSYEIPLATQQQFFNDHLEPWVGRFFNDMQNAKAAHFYRSVGFFGESFFDFERQLLDMQS